MFVLLTLIYLRSFYFSEYEVVTAVCQCLTALLSCPQFLKVPWFLKTQNIGFPHHICTLRYFRMSVHSVYKAVCKVYSKKIHQVLVEQQEN